MADGCIDSGEESSVSRVSVKRVARLDNTAFDLPSLWKSFSLHPPERFRQVDCQTNSPLTHIYLLFLLPLL